MQVRCIYVGYWKHETHNSQKNAEKTGRLYTECTRRYEPVKLAIANDIPFYSRRDALAGCGKIVVSDQFLGWFESFWSFRASES